jgi:predicted phage-related endonuclease
VTDTDFAQRRKGRIGASDVAAAITGIFGSPAAVIAGKLDLVDKQPTPRMLLGLSLEDRVIDSAAALLGATVAGRQVEVTSPDYPWLTATCDALLELGDGPGSPLEVKTTHNPDGYPSEYLEAQLHAQMICCQTTRGFSAVRNLTTGELTVVEHQADPVIGVAVVEMGEILWEHLQAGTVPSPVFPADSDLWNRLHPVSTAATVELPDDLVTALVAARAEAKHAQNRADVLEAEIKERLGDCETGTVDGAPAVLWRTVISRRVDLKSLEAVAPELVEEHRKESTARRFTVVSPIHPSSRKAIPS